MATLAVVLCQLPLPCPPFACAVQSYTGYEPTSMRAIRARYDPYVQARSRVDQLRKLGHSVDKVGPTLCAAYIPCALRRRWRS